MMKKVSVLMMTYDSEKTIAGTLDAIISQDYPDIEIVISDGGSKDDTLKIIEGYKDKAEINIVSEPDKGLYDALNKSVRRAKGDYLIVNNDRFTDKSAITKLVNATESGNYVGAHSDLVYADGDEVKRYWKMGDGKIRNGWLPGHPTLLLKKEIYDKYGEYKDDFKIAADYEFMVRFLKDKENRLAYVNEVLVSMYYGGTSTGGLSNYIESLKEGNRALKENGVRMRFFITALRTFRVLCQFCR